jgi:hypothetical protein
MASADLPAPLYAAIIGNGPIAAALATYQGAPAAFTRRPVPKDALYPMVITAGDVTRTDQDFINNPLPVIIRDISVFGQNDTAAHSRAVDAIALMVRDLFHRQRQSLSVPGWKVLDIVCRGPIVGPTDDDTTVHRLITMTVRLSQ